MPLAPPAHPLLITRMLSRITYAQKFMIITTLFAISILITGYFMVRMQNRVVEFTEIKLQRNLYERALMKLSEDMAKHKMVAFRYLSGKNDLKEEFITLTGVVDTDFNTLIQIDSSIRHQSTSPDTALINLKNLKPEDIRKSWQDLNKDSSQLTIEEIEAWHDKIIETIRLLISDIGKTANLTLDPSIDSDYLVETLIEYLPQTQTLVAQIAIYGEKELKHDASPSQKKKLSDLASAYQSSLAGISSALQQGLPLVKESAREDELESLIKEPLHRYLDASKKLLHFIDEEILQSEKPTGQVSELYSLSNAVLEYSDILWDAASDLSDKILKERIEKYHLHQKIYVSIAILSALIGFVLGLLFIYEIRSVLKALVTASQRLAAGDLSTRVQVAYADEPGQVGIAFNQMAESFQQLIGQLQWTGIQLTTSTAEFASAAKQQETTVAEQEETTKRIALTATEISLTAKDLAKTMNEVSSSAEQTSSLALSGKSALNSMETIMRQMVDASETIAARLGILNERASNIANFITTIAKVADQTNLLSLNAAIEAEKAGEHGRSFSVIAREIRRLADQTANATLDIEKLIKEMASAVSSIVIGVDKFSEEIRSGVGQVSNVSEQLTKIIEQVQQQTQSFDNVNKGMQAQSLGAKLINDSINQLSHAAQKTSESIHQFHYSIEQLHNTAREMQTAISKIKR